MSDFFKEIQARQLAAKVFEDKYNKDLALNFNALDFLNWNENKVSELLAYFLNPKAGHEQGALYLKIFVEYLEINFPTQRVNKVSVKLEEATYENRRVDIVISCDNYEHVIGIENKIYTWTSDQENQLKDYYLFLESITKSNDFTLIYLSPKGKSIPKFDFYDSENISYENLIESRKLISITYEDQIIPVLELFIRATDNVRVRSFLQDFKQKLVNNYLGKENLNSNMIKNYITESSKNIKTAFDVVGSLNQVKESLKEELSKQMHELALDLGGVYNDEFRHFEFAILKNNYIKYNYEMGGVIYGIVKKVAFNNVNPNKIDYKELKSYLGGKFKTSHWWPLYTLKYDNIDVKSDFWIDVVDGKFKDFMKAFITSVLKAPSDVLEGV